MLQKFLFNAGIVKDDPPLTAEGFWVDGNNVRFYRGKPEKINGWVKFTDTAITGKARKLINWSDQDGDKYLGIGTSTKLEVYISEDIHNITPITTSGTASGLLTLTTTISSTTVTIGHASHQRSVGDTVIFANQVSPVGGVTLSGSYEVISVPNINSYTIEVASPASSTVAAGAMTIDWEYELTISNEYGIGATGWGSGGWGYSGWGTPRAGSFVIYPRTWSLSAFGNYMLANPYGGTLYVWDAVTTNRAAAEPNAPSRVNTFFVSPERFVVALGTHDYATNTYNPMLVRWADQETYDTWTQSATNTAGEFPLSSGAEIIGGGVSKLQNLIWTDTSLYAMRYLGDRQYIFGFDLLGSNCGLAGPNAWADKDGFAFWMAPTGQFFVYDGGSPKTLDSPLRKYVTDRLNYNQLRLVQCGINSQYNEVTWWYCSAESNEVDSSVTYNYVENCWTLGDHGRTAWVDKSLFDHPIGAGSDGYLYSHEVGVDADGVAISSFIESAPFDLNDGGQVMNISRIVPDVDVTGNLDVTLTTKRWSNDVTEQTKNLTFTESSTRLDTRAQGRVARIRFGSDGVEDWWRVGDVRMDINEAGRR